MSGKRYTKNELSAKLRIHINTLSDRRTFNTTNSTETFRTRNRPRRQTFYYYTMINITSARIDFTIIGSHPERYERISLRIRNVRMKGIHLEWQVRLLPRVKTFAK